MNRRWTIAIWLCVAFASFVVSVAISQTRTVDNDFSQNVWLPARLVLNGANPFNPTYAQVDTALGVYRSAFPIFSGGPDYYFIYPIWVALAWLPFGAIPLIPAMIIWRTLDMLLLVWAVGAVLRGSNAVFRVVSRPVALTTVVATTLALGFPATIVTIVTGQSAIIEFALLAAVWNHLGSRPFCTSPDSVRTTAADASHRSEAGLRITKHSGVVGYTRAVQWRYVIGDVLAGLALVALSTKPQANGLAVVLLGLWALSQRRIVMALSAVVGLAAVQFLPLLLFPWSLEGWLRNLFGPHAQATSQAQVSWSIWGLSYQVFGAHGPWRIVAGVVMVLCLCLLLPCWLRDLRDHSAPFPRSLPLTVCVNSVASPYLLGNEQVLLLFPALVLLSQVSGLHMSVAPVGKRASTAWRFIIYTWAFLISVPMTLVQDALQKDYPGITLSAVMLVLCLYANKIFRQMSGDLGASASKGLPNTP
jgi:hypothetical protein